MLILAALDHALAHHVAVLDRDQHGDPEADQMTAAAPDLRLTKSELKLFFKFQFFVLLQDR